VFLVGFEDGLFPGMRAIGDREEMEEERRLCYVAITRAKQTLTISHARQRMLYGRTNAAMKSRFLNEIPEECVIHKGVRARAESFGYSGYGASYSEGYGNTFGGYPQRRPTQQEIAAKERMKRSENSVFTSKPQQGLTLDFNKGDMVKHAAFGKGMILSVMKMGGDALLEIAFDDIGTKKLMAKTASVHMKKL
jgi:DNA helicase-2/ATP-dependent DNA helicase PcrA